jgi:hypothetical protein
MSFFLKPIVAQTESRNFEQNNKGAQDNSIMENAGSGRRAHLLLDLEQPAEHFLVGKTMKGACQPIHTSRKGEVRV